MKRGIIFEIPNAHGKFLGDILKPLDIASFNWKIEGESYIVENGELADTLFPEEVMNGSTLAKRIQDNVYYCICADLKAFLKDQVVHDIETYEQFIESNCLFVLLVVDCTYATIYCKDLDKLECLYEHAKTQGFTSLDYVSDETDERTSLSF
ncbi:DUF2691 family protein [Niallia circulans]|uniref:DUF2691 family protein n=1 Tax=Niallia circulans TaxID=1397 RepID=A0A553SRC3_NIACI|nr:DUF2691 family protein [Niallia circulans]TRZ39547.1 DUF2691 family protein [Niallia circulans]